MKYFASLLVLAAIFLASCSDLESVTYIGKTLEYQYGESIYHVTFDSDSEMHWEAVAGDETDAKETENYKAEWVDSQKLFITWGEANGIGVSQILDFENGIVYNHLLRGREVNVGTGKISWVE